MKTTDQLDRPALQIDPHGWCAQARRVPSPNCDARPDGADVSLLVVHNISLPAGQFGGPYINQLFTNQLDCSAVPEFASLLSLRVSAHFLIRRDGQLIQFVPTIQRAWHAGVSIFEGRERCNDFSVGVELEGSDLVAFTDAQYNRLTALTIALQQAHPLRAVCGHEHVAPARKTDPGPFFEWHRYQSQWSSRSAPDAPKEGSFTPLKFVSDNGTTPENSIKKINVN